MLVFVSESKRLSEIALMDLACQFVLGLLAGAGRLLAPGAPLYLYGPYRRQDVATAPSNEAFDCSLRARNPAWGLRHLEDVTEAAENRGLELVGIVAMPANNLSVIYRRS